MSVEEKTDATPPDRMRFVRRITRRFVRLPTERRLLLGEAVVWLALARLALVFVPFRVLAARFGTVSRPDMAAPAASALAADQAVRAREIGWAVTRAAKYVPFRAVCLPQAIAAKAMLGRRDIASVMHFGVQKKKSADEPLSAHAWLDADAIEVTGFPVAEDFVEVARFL